MDTKKNRKQFFRLLIPAFKYKWVYVILFFIGISLTVADLLFAQTSRILFDLAPNISYSMAVKIIVYFVAVILAQFILGFINSYMQSYLNESVIYEMRRNVLRKVIHLKVKFFDANHTSTVLNIFFNQIEAIKEFAVYAVQDLMRLPITFILISSYLFTVHPILGITAFLSSALQLLSNSVFRKSLGKALDNQRKVSNDVFFTIEEATQGIREVKINQTEDMIDSQMKDCQYRGVKYNVDLTKYRTLRDIVREIPTKTGYVFGIGVGIFLMIDGKINPGDLIAYITLLGKMTEPFINMVRIYALYQESFNRAKGLMDLMSEEEEAYTDGENMERDIESIKFRNVSFKYEIDEDLMKDQRDELMFSDEFDSEKNNNTNILEDVSFEIKGGSTVALVGPSGSGKSTIVKLLYRFYHPQSGEILVNGKPITSYNVNSVRENMTLVSQDVFIFDGSVRENLILGRTDITDEEIENALKYSQSYDFVQKLSEGINTKLGERGIKISHGQKQRLSIARSIIKKANIVILDEPTSALDVDTEALFQKNLSEWSEGSTKIIIAHRLTTIRNADYVLFLDDGKVIEQGSPQELIRQNGRFREFWEKQFIFTEDGSTVI